MEKGSPRLESAAEVAELRARLAEAEETLRAISNGEADALLLTGEHGKKVHLIGAGDRVYRQFMETINEGTAIVDAVGVILSCNASLAKMLGLPLDRVQGSDLSSHLVPEERDTVKSILTERGTESHRRIIHLRTGDGVPVPVYVTATRLEASKEKPVYCLQFTDLQDVVSAEAAVCESEELYRELLDLAPVGITVFCEEKIAFVNPAGAHMFGADSEDLVIGKPVADFVTPETSKSAHSQIRRLISGEDKLFSTEDTFHRLDGTSIDVEIMATPIKYKGKPAVQLIFSDITDRKRMNTERDRLMAAIEQVVDSVLITDPEGTIQYVNPAFEALSGYTRAETLGRNPRFFKSGKHSREFYAELWETISSGSTWKGVFVNKRKDGEERTIESTISPVRAPDNQIINYVKVGHDVTTQLLSEERLRQAQKMETVGQFAGGVAHDFNNMLQVIISYSELSLTIADPGERLHNYILEIRRAAQRSAEITGQLLAFSRQQPTSPEIMDLNTATTGSGKMIQRLIGENIDLVYLPGPDLWKVKIDPTQVDQIVANLAVNARDAIDGVGTLNIRTQNIILDKLTCDAIPDSTPGEYVLLTVSDDGCGMTRETAAHLFEPFFTTKETGKGTGLGLATVYGIVKQNNGAISVYSELGNGTTFKLYLPRVEAEVEENAAEVEPEFSSGGTETILVAEDDESILELARESLELLGYTVLAAGTPELAIQMSREQTGPIDLLITDVVMPQMNGRQLAEALLALRPTLKCLYMSGYTADIIGHRGILDEGMNFIAKPFSLLVLAEKVREVIDG